MPEAGFGILALSANAKTLVSGTDEAIRLWDVASGKSTGVIPNPGWRGNQPLAISPDGKAVASSRQYNTVALWETATGKPILQDFKGHLNGVAFAACSPDGSLIVSGGQDGRIVAWDAKTGAPKYERQLGRDSSVFSMTMSPDGMLLAAGGVIDGHNMGGRSVTRVWKAQTGEQVRDFGSPEGPYMHTHSLRFSSDGRLLAIAAEIRDSNADDIDVWKLATGRKVAEIRPKDWHFHVLDMAFSADLKVLHSVWADRVQAWELKTGKQLDGFVPHLGAGGARLDKTRFQSRFQIGHALFSPDAKRLFTSQEDAVVVWDVATGKAISTARLPGTNKGRYLGLSRDGRLLAAAEVQYWGDPGTGGIEICAVDRDTGNIRIWSHDDGRANQAALAGDGRVIAFAFSPDNKRLITGMDRGAVLAWELETAGAR